LPKLEQVDGHTYTLPAVVAVALQTNRPEVLRALKDEAADKFRELSDGAKADMISELFKLIADLMEDKKKLRKTVDKVGELLGNFESVVMDVEGTVDDFRALVKDLDV
jgi:hypothetical protein